MLHPDSHEWTILKDRRGNTPIEERSVTKAPTCCCDGDGGVLDGDVPRLDGVKVLIQSRICWSFFTASLPI
jgi:hypothetical protein